MAANHEHPHARGEDEVFRAYFVYGLNVDMARRLIASGEITAVDYAMPVQKAGQMLLGLSEAEFGCAPPGGPYPEERGISMMATHVDRRLLADIPAEAMALPALMVMWDTDASHRLVNRSAKPTGSAPHALLVDGNHRLARRYLEGDQGTMDTLVVRDWAAVEKFLSVQGRPVSVAKAPGRKRRADGEQGGGGPRP